MTLLRDPRPILGIDPTHDGMVFVFFENGILVDWGTSRDDGLRTFDRLIDDYGAESVVLEDGDATRSERRPRMKKLLRDLAAHGRKRGLTVINVSRRRMRAVWEKSGVRRKQGVAAELVKLFPDLAPILPPPRKVYRREVPRERIFGTVALVVHAFGAVPPNGTSLASASS